MDRRAFLRLGVGGAALLAAQPVLGRDRALAEPAPGPFGHGVASGDPLADRVVLWTRVTPSEEATPGSGLGPPTEVGWEVATDAAFASVVAQGTAVTDAASDHTVKVDPAGLPPATDLWFRFRALGATSPVGRTRTAPAPGAAVDRLRVGLVSCSNWEGGWFSAYRHLAARDDLDLVLHLGDYVYEYEVGRYGPGSSFGRLHDPATEMVTLADYRRRHAQYKTDPDLQALHHRYAMVVTIDDHEVADNSWAEGAVNHQGDEGAYAARRSNALQAFFEWVPIRATGADAEPRRVYRSSSLGNLADLFVLDERTYRSRQPVGATGSDVLVSGPEPAAAGRTMLGAEQLAWFEAGLAASSARWKLVVNPVMFTPLVVADLPDVPVLTDVVLDLLATPGLSLPFVLNGDQWDGYQVEQAALRTTFGQTGGVVLLTGDIHSSWAAEVPADPGTYLPVVGGEAVAIELVTPAVSSDSFAAALAEVGLPAGEELAPHVPLLAETADPWFKYVEVTRQGYSVLEVTAEHVHWDLFHISDRTDRSATTARVVSFRSAAGSDRLTPAGPLPARPAAAPAPTPSVAVPPTAPAGATLPATGTPVPLAGAAVVAAAGLAAHALTRRADPQEPA